MIRVKKCETTGFEPGKSCPGFLYVALHCWPWDVEDESFEQEDPLGEADVEHKVEEEALVAETLLTGTLTQAAWATMMLNHSPGTL